MTKFVVWGFQNGADFNHPEIVAVCKTRDQAVEVIAAQMKEESDQRGGEACTRWFRIVPHKMPMPGFE